MTLCLEPGRGEIADGHQIGWCCPLFTSTVRSSASNLLYILLTPLPATNSPAYNDDSSPADRVPVITLRSSVQQSAIDRRTKLQTSGEIHNSCFADLAENSTAASSVRYPPGPPLASSRGLWFHLSCSPSPLRLDNDISDMQDLLVFFCTSSILACRSR